MAQLWIDEPRSVDGRLELAAIFEHAGGRQRLWYRVGPEWEEKVARNGDPFLIACLQHAMYCREDLRIRTAVSPSLLRNLDEFQRVWVCFKPELFALVSVIADREDEPNLGDRPHAISAMSGGLDSLFTAYRHHRGQNSARDYALAACAMVHGFDIPLEDPEGFRRASAKAERQTTSLGLPLVRVETNYRELPAGWNDTFGAGVAAVLSLFQGAFSTGLVAQGIDYGSIRFLQEGSNPLSDPLMSSRSFRIVADGSGFRRAEKIAAIAEWRAGMDDLRVCWKSQERDVNCCRCEKCLRTILTFRALGLPKPPSFPLDVSVDQIRRLWSITELKVSIGFGPIVEIAQANGMGKEPWVDALRKAIRRNRLDRKINAVKGGWRLSRIYRRLASGV